MPGRAIGVWAVAGIFGGVLGVRWGWGAGGGGVGWMAVGGISPYVYNLFCVGKVPEGTVYTYI